MAMHDRALSALTAIALTMLPLAAGCLEGDPNPLEQGASSGAITPGSPSTVPTVQPGNVCSQGSATAVTLTFRNQTSDRSIELFWVDYQCTEVRYTTIAPGASHAQPTFVAHPWRMRDTGTGALYKEFVASSAFPAVVSVP